MTTAQSHLSPLRSGLRAVTFDSSSAFRILRQPSLLPSTPDAPPTLEWLGPADWTADQLLLRAGHKPVLPLLQDRDMDFLAAFLKDGPRLTSDIWQAAQEQGL